MTISRPMPSPYSNTVITAATVVAIGCLVAAGCASVPPPPKASFTQTATFDRPPKSDDCFMPVLQTEPLTNHRRIAIVEAWGAVGQEDKVLAALKSRGCETGADALVIVEDRSQDNPAVAKFGLPESTRDEEARMDLTQGQRHKKELTPAIGEAGHPGYYLDSVAIVYDKIKADSERASH
jgi:hypothetical protein